MWISISASRSARSRSACRKAIRARTKKDEDAAGGGCSDCRWRMDRSADGQGARIADFALRGGAGARRGTCTLRHSTKECALPVRQCESFEPGTGVGGAGEHWAGTFDGMLPDSFEVY